MQPNNDSDKDDLGSYHRYLHHHLASKDIVSLGVCVSVCMSAALHIVSVRRAAATHHSSPTVTVMCCIQCL